MKSKILIILMSVVLLINIYDLRVFANNEAYDHQELSKYDGYGKAMYESIVEQTTFIGSRYTENLEYAEQSREQINSFAKDWYDSTTNKLGECYNFSATFLDCFGAHYDVWEGSVVTIADWIKNLFEDANESEAINPPPEEYGLDQYVKKNAGEPNFKALAGYCVVFSWNAPTSCSTGANLSIRATNSNKNLTFSDVNQGVTLINVPDRVKEVTDRYKAYVDSSSIALYGGLLAEFGFSFMIVDSKTKLSIPNFPNRNPNFENINNYIKDNPIKTVVPQPTAYLSCPDGNRINMAINGGTFLNIKGEVMQVSHDGTATVDSQICDLNWEKPKIEYVIIPNDDGEDIVIVGITTPTGEIIDAENGEVIKGVSEPEYEFDDEIGDDCGVLCAVGKSLKGLGDIIKAILSLPLKILDGLFELLKKVFVPPAGYWQGEMDILQAEFFHEDIKENVESLKAIGNVGGGTFEDVKVSLMGVSDLKVVDSSSINKSLDSIHGWVRGIFYPLLVFFNISMLYRLIRGTSLVGIGRKGGGSD